MWRGDLVGAAPPAPGAVIPRGATTENGKFDTPTSWPAGRQDLSAVILATSAPMVMDGGARRQKQERDRPGIRVDIVDSKTTTTK